MDSKKMLEKLQKDREILLGIKKQLQKMDERITTIIEDPEKLLKELG